MPLDMDRVKVSKPFELSPSFLPKWTSEPELVREEGISTRHSAQIRAELEILQTRYKFLNANEVHLDIVRRAEESSHKYQEPILQYVKFREKIAEELGETRAQAIALPKPVHSFLFSETGKNGTTRHSEHLALGNPIRAVQDGYSILTDPAYLLMRKEADEPESISDQVRREHPVRYKHLRHLRVPRQGVTSRLDRYIDFSRYIMDKYKLLPRPFDLDEKGEAEFMNKRAEIVLLRAIFADGMVQHSEVDVILNQSEQGQQLFDARVHIVTLTGHILWYYDDLVDGAAEDLRRLLGPAVIQTFIQDLNKITEAGFYAAARGEAFPEAELLAFQEKYSLMFAQIDENELLIVDREWLTELTRMARTLIDLFREKIEIQKNILHFSPEALAFGIETWMSHFDIRCVEVMGNLAAPLEYRWKRLETTGADIYMDECAMALAASRDYLANAQKFNAGETPILNRLVSFFDRKNEATLEMYWALDKARTAANLVIGYFNDIASMAHEFLDNNALWVDVKHSIYREGKTFPSMMDFYFAALDRLISTRGYEITIGILEEVYEQFLHLQAACETLKAMHPADPAIDSFIAIMRNGGGAPYFDWSLDETRYMGSSGPIHLASLLNAEEEWATAAESVVEKVIIPKVFPTPIQNAFRQMPYQPPKQLG